MGSDMSYAYVQADGAAQDRRQMTKLVEQLQAELADLREQLSATEKSYDAALQNNLVLQEEVRLMTQIRVVPILPTSPEADDIADELFTAASKTPKSVTMTRVRPDREPPKVISVSAELFGKSQAKTPMVDVPLPIPAMSATSIDDPLGPNSVTPEVREWYEGVVPTRTAKPRRPEQLSPEELTTAALKLIPDMVRAKDEAVGQRASMKDTLVRTQNACRRYKARLKRQRPQLEALQDLANAAFPLFAALTRSIEFSEKDHVVAALVAPVAEVRQQCIEFHNKFNQAAEALSYE